MYDYMKALQERFDEKQPEHLVYAVQAAREGLRDGIDARKPQEAASAAGRTERVAGRSQADELHSGLQAGSRASPENWERPTPSMPTRKKKQRR